MSNVYKILQEFINPQFEDESLEETIGFVSDNYYQALEIYRVIVQQTKEAEKQRKDAHNELQLLRDEDVKRQKSGKILSEADENENVKRKEYLSELREKEFDIMYNGKPLPHTQLTHIIVKYMWVFKILEKMDRKGRKKVGYVSSKVLSIALWPMRKMMELYAKDTDSLYTERFLKQELKGIKAAPEKLRKKIVNV